MGEIAENFVKIFNTGQRQGLIDAAWMVEEYRKMCMSNKCGHNVIIALKTVQELITLKSLEGTK